MNSTSIINHRNTKATVNLNALLFVFLEIAGVFYVVFTIYYNEQILRILSYVLIIAGYALYLVYLICKKNNPKEISIAMLLFLMLQVILTGLNYECFISSLSFFLCFASYELASAVPPSRRLQNIIFICSFLQGLVYITASFGKYAHFSAADGIVWTDYLILGLANPNETGIALAYVIFVIFITMQNMRKRITKALSIVLICCLVYLLIGTRCRTAFVGVCIFIFLSLFRKRNNILFEKRGLFLLFPLCSMLFVPLYLLLFHRTNNKATFFDKTIFSGRQNVYQHAFDRWNNKLFGNLDEFLFHNMHNGFLAIAASIGLLGLLIYLIHLFKQMDILRRSACSNESRIGFIAILCIYLMSSTEAAFLVGGHQYFTNFLVLCWIANYKSEREIL